MLKHTALRPTFFFALGIIVLLAVNLSHFHQPEKQSLININVSDLEAPEGSEPSPEVDPIIVTSATDEHLQGLSILGQPVYRDAEESERKALLTGVVRELMVRERYQEVVQLIKDFPLEKRIEDGVQFSYARALAKVSETVAAEESYRNLLRAEPSHSSSAINLSLMLNRQQRHGEVDELVRQSLKFAEGNKKGKLLAIRATAQEKLGETELALNSLRDSIRVRPDHASTWLKFARLSRQLDAEPALVSDAYRNAVVLSDSHFRYQAMYGRYLLETLAFEAAIKELQEAVDQAPADTELRRLLAWGLLETNRKVSAREHWVWLSINDASSEHRLVARHLVAALDAKSPTLKPLDGTSDEFIYARALLATYQQENIRSELLLDQIPTSSAWYERAQRRINLLRIANG